MLSVVFKICGVYQAAGAGSAIWNDASHGAPNDFRLNDSAAGLEPTMPSSWNRALRQNRKNADPAELNQIAFYVMFT